MKILKTLGKTTWDKLKIGEVFAWNGCWRICYKKSNNIVIQIAIDEYPDWEWWLGVPRKIWLLNTWDYPFYKLSKSVQKLWKEE